MTQSCKTELNYHTCVITFKTYRRKCLVEEEERERGRRKKGQRKRERKRREHSYDENCYTSQYLVHLGTLFQQQVLYVFKRLNRKVGNRIRDLPNTSKRGGHLPWLEDLVLVLCNLVLNYDWVSVNNRFSGAGKQNQQRSGKYRLRNIEMHCFWKRLQHCNYGLRNTAGIKYKHIHWKKNASQIR